MKKSAIATMAILVGCAGMQRDCASCCASETGADWVVVQVDMRGQPFRCWELRNTAIDNESGSDGIYWRESSGNLVHISNFYNRVQVLNGQWGAAFQELGLTAADCRAVRARPGITAIER